MQVVPLLYENEVSIRKVTQQSRGPIVQVLFRD